MGGPRTPGKSRSGLRDQLLQLFRYLEDGYLARRDIDRVARAGVARHPRLSILHLERAESADLDVLAGAQGLANRTQELINRVGHILLGEARLLGDLVHDIRLG